MHRRRRRLGAWGDIHLSCQFMIEALPWNSLSKLQVPFADNALKMLSDGNSRLVKMLVLLYHHHKSKRVDWVMLSMIRREGARGPFCSLCDTCLSLIHTSFCEKSYFVFSIRLTRSSWCQGFDRFISCNVPTSSQSALVEHNQGEMCFLVLAVLLLTSVFPVEQCLMLGGSSVSASDCF